jgi:hypothetical protein
LNAAPAAGRGARLAVIAALAAAAAIALWLQGPIPQDPAYHRFADTRGLWGIPNFGNVVSNLPFLLAGPLGLWRVLRGRLDPLAARQRVAWAIFFAGTTLVGVGSAYYHLQPDDARLVWDRLPMTLGFMALTAALLGEYVGVRVGRRALPVLLVLGLASVVYWRAAGDLRPYALVQFLPILLIPAGLLALPAPAPHRGVLWASLAAYVLAKVLEFADAGIYVALVGSVSGHSLKHVAAAAGVGLLAYYLRVRQEAGTGSAE